MMTFPSPCGVLMSFLMASGTAMTSAATGSHASPPDALSQWAQARTEARESGAIMVARIDGDAVTLEAFGHRSWPDGPAPDGDTRFQIGSVGKVFTNLLLAERVAAGAVRYDQPLASLLPDDVSPANRAVAAIPLLALATHRSGLSRLPANFASADPADPYAGYDQAALWAGVEQARAGQPLGSHYGYSNFGIGLLGHLLGRQAGSDYFGALAEHVTRPLAMTDTGKLAGDNHAVAVSGGELARAWGNDDALTAAGGLWGSSQDLVRLLQAYLGRHEHALRHDLADDLAIVAAGDEGMSVTRVWHVAHAGRQPIFWHNGGTMTYWSFAGFRPDNGQGLVVLTSGDADPTAMALATLGYPPASDSDSAVAPDTALVGQYRLSDSVAIAVFERQGRLFARLSGQAALALHPVAEDWYALHEVDASVTFRREQDAVVELTLVQGGHRQVATRTSDQTPDQWVEVHLPADAYAQYVGRYAFAPGVEFTIREQAGGLEAMLTGQTWLPIHAAGDDRFFYQAVDASLQFSRDHAGVIDALTLHQGEIVQRAPRITGVE